MNIYGVCTVFGTHYHLNYLINSLVFKLNLNDVSYGT